LETVVVRQKSPTPAVAGFYLGKTAKAVYLASSRPCDGTGCRRVMSIPEKQVTCLVFGPSRNVPGDDDHDPEAGIMTGLDYFKRGMAGDVCAGATATPNATATASATSGSRSTISTTTSSRLSILPGLRIVLERASPAPRADVRVIGPFRIVLGSDSEQPKTTGGGRVVLGSVLFRFGKAGLTRPARAGVAVAAREITDAGAARVFVAGHADEKGDEAGNVRLSRRRANRVEKALRKRLPKDVKIIARGYGERLPLRCNRLKDGSDDRKSRAVNRRVEIRTRRLMTAYEQVCMP
jgi:outer membrane protein OmpA-like peptidoglycan-associated protein